MRREVRMEDISDGKLYRAEDLVRAGCGGCEGCSACCRHMGESVILDPLDIYNLNIGAKVGLGELFSRYLELHVVDGVILPTMKMTGECRKKNRSKVRVSHFIDIPDLKANEVYVADWHYFLLDAQRYVQGCGDQERAKQVNLEILNRFFLTPYQGGRDFYGQFYERFQAIQKMREEWRR